MKIYTSNTDVFSINMKFYKKEEKEKMIEIEKKKIKRYNQTLRIKSYLSLKERLEVKRNKHFRKIIKEKLKVSDEQIILKYNASSNNIKIDYILDWNYYSKNCKFPKKIYNAMINIKNKKIPSEYEYDGIINFSLISKKKINDKTIEKMIICKSARGYKIELQTCYIASLHDYHYHANSIDKAIKGLNKKIKNNFKLKNLSLESEITRKDYHELTGACMLGINNFLKNNNLSHLKKIKISDLLPFIKKSYGYEKILKLI